MRIFLSYRRQDANHAAGRLADRLRKRFGKGNVFVDVTNIVLGSDFRAAITQAVNECDVLLAIIGKGWVDARTEAGNRRLDDDADLMRLEIVAGLDRGIPVIPVLLDDAPEPRADQLPPQLKPFAGRQAVRMSHANFDADVDGLMRSLAGDRRSRSRTAIVAGAVGIAGVAVAIAVTATLGATPRQGPPTMPTPDPSTAPAQSASAAPAPGPSPAAAGCNYVADGKSIIAPTVTAAGEQTGLTFCPVRINDGSLPISGPFELDGRVLGPVTTRQELLLMNYGDPKTCDAFGVAPARGAFLSNDTKLDSADGNWSHTDHLGYPEAVTIVRHYEFITASLQSLDALKNDRQIYDDAHLGKDGDYPGILNPPQDVKVLATFLVPAGQFAGAAPCNG